MRKSLNATDFLKARLFTQLHKRLCQSVGLLIRGSVDPLFVGPLVRGSDGPSVMIKSKTGIASILDIFCLCLYVGGGDWGVYGGWTPLPTRPQ